MNAATLNAMHRAFWAERAPIFEAQMADDLVREFTRTERERERVLDLPICYRFSRCGRQ